ncbi:MAG: glutathione S-transferase [Zoogloea oleivorans]|jgi:glutathione S-transferase|uniref:glutathione S-transferase family protein n=1 Tax=Zoogloea oleivorans TaxID=1552750 RepID=UPI002A365D56|nr:glutathione S-transferase [Zoogloea oleivorans]MDY0037735.1 glutathione S-transferase [Zoogloea oleivorans]
MNAPAQPIKFYRFTLSGHSHRAELFLSLLGLPVEPIDVDLAGGEQKRPAYLAMNGFGQVPVIQDGDVTVADSNAILVYLASRYGSDAWLPRDPAGAAQVQRWLSVAAGQVAYGPCAARLVTVFKATFNPDEVIARAHALFAIMEKELAASPFLVGEHATIADVANYTYIAHAPEGNVSLDAYPAIRAWLARIEALPGFVPMPKTAIGLAA